MLVNKRCAQASQRKQLSFAECGESHDMPQSRVDERIQDRDTTTVGEMMLRVNLSGGIDGVVKLLASEVVLCMTWAYRITQINEWSG